MADEPNDRPAPISETRHHAIEELARFSASFLCGPGPHSWERFADGLLDIAEHFLILEIEERVAKTATRH